MKEDIYNKKKIKYTKGNIPINQKLYGKYSNVKEIFENESNSYKSIINISKCIPELENINTQDLSNSLSNKEAKKLAREIFNKYNNTNEIVNNGNKIIVTGSGIDECITKIISIPEQKKLLLEHWKIFSNLENIIKNAKLVNQVKEIKNRNKYNFWNYYIISLSINNVNYILEFEVACMDSGENHYRVQKLKKIDASHGDANNNDRILPFNETSISDNNIT